MLESGPLIPTEWLFAAAFVLLAGMLTSRFVADYQVAEPPVRRRMRMNTTVGVGIVVALAGLTLASVWLFLAVGASDGCAAILGIGGCLR